jgi:hypothetical protein
MRGRPVGEPDAEDECGNLFISREEESLLHIGRAFHVQFALNRIVRVRWGGFQ